MTYSRKRYWLALGAALVVVVVFLSLIPQMHPVFGGLWMKMAVVAVCAALAFLAYFSLDEIQRQNEMRAWYYGAPLAIMFGVVPFLLLMPNALLDTMADLLPHGSKASPDMPHSPRDYIGLGVAVTVLMQAIGYFIARAIFSAAERAR